jgi:Protein of unknown function (DUF2911)
MLLAALALLAADPNSGPLPGETVADTACPVHFPDRIPALGRRSPLDSLTLTVGGQSVKLCYGRPSARGRVMIGGRSVPYGKLWRTGANEPTVIFTPIALSVAGVKVPPGKYTLYTVPGETEWQVIVNRSTSQWGQEGYYTAEVAAQEAGRGSAASERIRDHFEQFTIRSESGALILEWETTRVTIPVTPA